MEAPEKIYLFENLIIRTLDDRWLSKRHCNNDIEYTRTDAFIEKACSWLRESITNNPKRNRIISKKGVITMGLLIEDFKKHMKGE